MGSPGLVTTPVTIATQSIFSKSLKSRCLHENTISERGPTCGHMHAVARAAPFLRGLSRTLHPRALSFRQHQRVFPSRSRHFRNTYAKGSGDVELNACLPTWGGTQSILARPVPNWWYARVGLRYPPSSLRARAIPGEHEAILIDGKSIAEQVREEIKADVVSMKAAFGVVPGLAVVLVGTRADSATYVRSKKKACDEAGIVSYGTELPDDVSEEELLKVVAEYNADPLVHGILVQLPLPKHIDEEKILDAISIEKDVDGFHPRNIGELVMRNREPMFVPCTPKGCIELLDRSNVVISGKRAAVLGRSNIVGIPAAALLQNRDATVTVLHSRTPTDVAKSVLAEADIVVAGAGIPEFVKGEWLKQGCVVIDVGINSIPDKSKKRGYRLVGDVDFEGARRVAGMITPVPGGVGPMTIAMLLRNTLESATRSVHQSGVRTGP